MPDIRSILDPIGVDNTVKAQAWDDFHAAQNPEDFQRRFDALALPTSVKADLWDLKFSKAPRGPQPPSLPTLPDLPKPPNPILSAPQTPPVGLAALAQQENEAGNQARAIGEHGIETMRAGADTAREGLRNVQTPGKRAKGASQIIRGTMEAASPIAIPLAAPLMIAGGPAALGGAAIGAGMSKATEAGLKALGVDEGVSELAGDLAGLPGYTGSANAILKGLRGPQAIRPNIIRRPEGPNIFPPDIPAATAGVRPAAEAMKAPGIVGKSAEESAALFQQMPQPKSAMESAKVFERPSSPNQAQRRASVEPVAEGIPEEVLRAQDRREQLAQKLTGKPWQELNNPERIQIDELLRGEATREPKARPIKVQPRGKPAVSQGRQLSQRGAISGEDVQDAAKAFVKTARRVLERAPKQRVEDALTSLEEPGIEIYTGKLREATGLPKQEFDQAVLDLSREGKVFLAEHDHPNNISAADRDALVQYTTPTGETQHFVAVAKRPEPRNPEKGAVVVPVEDIREGSRKLRTALTDRYAELADLEKGLGIPLEDSAHVGARSFGGHQGKIEDRLIDLARIVRPAKKSGLLKEANDYATLERHLELGGRLPNYKIPGGKTLADIASEKQAFEAARNPAQLKQVNDLNVQLRDYSDTLLQELRDAGIISPKGYQAIKANNEKYIPFQRLKNVVDEIDRSIPAGSNAFSVAGQNLIQKVEGSSLEIADPLESLVRNTFRAKSLIERNTVAQKLAAYANRKEFSGVVMHLKPGQTPGPGYDSISYLQNGVKHQVAVPTGVAAAMKNLNKESADIVTRAMAFWGAALRSGVTLDPTFMAKNLIRDVQTAHVTQGLGPADFAYGLVASLTRGIDQKSVPAWLSKIGAGDETYRQFLRSGGAFGGFYHHGNVLATARNLTTPTSVRVLKTVVNPLELMRTAGETAELGTRLGVFRKASRAGSSLEEAGWKARTGTVDFERAGNQMRVINMMVPFLNARLQGTLNLARTAREAPMATAFRLATVAGVPALATYFYNATEHPQEWSEIADYEKDNNYIIITGNGRDERGNLTQAVKIPKGEVKPFVNTAIDMLEYLRGTNQKEWRKIATTFMSDLSPVPFERGGNPSIGAAGSAVLPPPLKSVVQLATGKDLYTGRDTVPSRPAEPASPSKRYGNDTPIPFVKAGQALSRVGVEVSPEALKHEMGTLFGHLGRRATDVMPTAESPRLNFGKLFTGMGKAFSGAQTGQTSTQYDQMHQDATARANRMSDVQRAADLMVKELDKLPDAEFGSKLEGIRNRAIDSVMEQNPRLSREEALRLVDEEASDILTAKAEGLTPFERTLRRQPAEVRAASIARQIEALPPDKLSEVIKRYRDKKILTDKVEDEIGKILASR